MRLNGPARFAHLPVQEMVRLPDVPTGGKLVDLGTGTGTYAIELARLRPDIEVIALEELREMLDRLRAKRAAALTNLKLVLAGKMGDSAKKNDRILALHPSAGRHELGDEASRYIGPLLKPDGFALFIDWNGGVEHPAGPPPDHLHTPREAPTRLGRIGFKIELGRPFSYPSAGGLPCALGLTFECERSSCTPTACIVISDCANSACTPPSF